MKKLLLFVACLSMLSPLIAEECYFEDYSADYCQDTCNDWDFCHGWQVEVRGAGVYSSSSRYREIYSDWSPEVQFEIAKSVWKHLYAWFNAAYLWDEGHSQPFHDKTQIRLVPLTFGLKYIFPVTCDFSVYLGGGAAYSFLRIHDHSPYVRKHTSREAWGGVVKSGIQYEFCESFFLDVFADYLFQHFSPPNDDDSDYRYIETRSANLSGLRIGAGVGMKF